LYKIEEIIIFDINFSGSAQNEIVSSYQYFKTVSTPFKQKTIGFARFFKKVWIQK